MAGEWQGRAPASMSPPVLPPQHHGCSFFVPSLNTGLSGCFSCLYLSPLTSTLWSLSPCLFRARSSKIQTPRHRSSHESTASARVHCEGMGNQTATLSLHGALLSSWQDALAQKLACAGCSRGCGITIRHHSLTTWGIRTGHLSLAYF